MKPLVGSASGNPCSPDSGARGAEPSRNTRNMVGMAPVVSGTWYKSWICPTGSISQVPISHLSPASKDLITCEVGRRLRFQSAGEHPVRE